MSSQVDPVIRVFPGDRKVRTVTFGLTAGANNGSAPVPGIEFAEQILAWQFSGTGTSTALGAALGSPFISYPNTVGISVTSAVTMAGISVTLLVQGQ